MEVPSQTFGCSIGTLPFTYLGLPMGTTKPKIEDLTPMMDRVERCLSGCSTTYTMCTIKLLRGVIENIDLIRKQYLWRGNTDMKRGGNLMAWETVQKPKRQGGLGIVNLRLQNDAFLLKHLHKFYNQANIPWVKLVRFKYYQDKVPHATREIGSFWWKDVMRLNNIYRSMFHCIVGNGSTVCFWEDRWIEYILAVSHPRIASFARSNTIYVKEIMQATGLDNIFMLPLSQEALDELNHLQEVIHSVPYDESGKDIWLPTWGPDYTSKKFYPHIYDMLEAHPVYKMNWKSSCTPTIKFFIWLVLVDRLNTKTVLTRRHIAVHQDDICVMCDIEPQKQLNIFTSSVPLEDNAGRH